MLEEFCKVSKVLGKEKLVLRGGVGREWKRVEKENLIVKIWVLKKIIFVVVVELE